MYVIPARNRVYLELRRHAEGTHAMRRLPWKLKDWLESAAAPALAQSIARAVPFRRVRYSLIDGFNDAVHALMNNAVGHEGSHALEQTGASALWAARAFQLLDLVLQGRRLCARAQFLSHLLPGDLSRVQVPL
jgi:hypothetical protein